jgi:hypothetical protein
VCPAVPYDEVLAARLAEGLLRVQWLGAAVERLIRRLAGRAGRPAAGGYPTVDPAVGGLTRPGCPAGE